MDKTERVLQKRRRKLLFVGLSILIVWAILFGVDFYRFSANKTPLFGIPIHKSGVASSYIGLGYKVVDKNRNVTEMKTLFGRHKNFSLTEDDTKLIEDYFVSGEWYSEFDEAESFASFSIFGHSFLSENEVEIYMWVVNQTFFPQRGSVVKEGGSSIPCLVTVDITDDRVMVTNSQYPRDGSLYSQDMKEMFPTWVRFRLNNIYRTEEITKLSQENEDKARQHFFPLDFDN